MNPRLQTFAAAFLLGIAYHFFFWQEKQGINLVLFFLLTSSLLLIFYPGVFRLNRVRTTWLGVLALALLVVLFNSDVSKISFWIMLAAGTGLIHQPQLRTAGHAMSTSLTELITSPANWWGGLELLARQNNIFTALWRYQKLGFLPLIVVGLFYILYSVADAEFNHVSSGIFDGFFRWLSEIISHLFFESFLFFCSGLLIASAILFNRDLKLFVHHELNQSDFLLRRKAKRLVRRSGIEFWELFFRRTMLSLKNEYSRGIILLTLVNALLLAVNIIDIRMVWFEHAAFLSPVARSQAVHESTYLLLFSILLAMALLLFLFRGNINFIKTNLRIRQLAYLWIAQNLLLVITVGIRNYYYIRDYGLAYRRIGVIFFLLLTLCGLFTLFLKIRDKKSFFYLYRVNGWLACALLILLSCFNWDPLIAEYNLAHFSRSEIDRQFLMSLSHRALPVLIQHKDVFIKEETIDETGISKQEQWLLARAEAFRLKYESTSWLSWNYADHYVYRFLKNQKPLP